MARIGRSDTLAGWSRTAQFAHAGSRTPTPRNLLRFERDEALTAAVLGAWTCAVGGTPEETLALARAADLWALVDLAARRGANPVANRAHDLLLAIAEAGPGE